MMKIIFLLGLIFVLSSFFVNAADLINIIEDTYSPQETATGEMSLDQASEKGKSYNASWFNNTVSQNLLSCKVCWI